MGIGTWLRRLFARPQPAASPAGVPAPAGTGGPVWCVAANAAFDRPYGPAGAERRRGTKHFAPGAKVYVFHFYWGMGGERVTVVGRHRRSKRYITLVMPAAHLANWRAELVYSPHVVRQVLEHGDFAALPPGGAESRAKAERIADSYRQNGGRTQPFVTRPPTDDAR